MLWLVAIAALLAGAFSGGWRSLRLARQGDTDGAAKAQRTSAVWAAACGILMTVPALGWPFKEVSVSVPETVARTVVETVEVPVRATSWFFWTVVRGEKHDVTVRVNETVYRPGTASEFSPWLLVAMAGVGVACYYAQTRLVRLLNHWFG